MSKLGKDLIEGMEQILDWTNGKKVPGAKVVTVTVPDTIDVKAIRAKQDMSQREFAAFYGFKITALQAWEQGKRKPDHNARILLKVIERNPAAVHQAMLG